MLYYYIISYYVMLCYIYIYILRRYVINPGLRCLPGAPLPASLPRCLIVADWAVFVVFPLVDREGTVANDTWVCLKIVYP